MQISFKKILAKILAWIHAPELHNSVANTNTFYAATRDDTGVSVDFGIGSGGINHGVYSNKLGRWLIYADNSNVYIPPQSFSVTLNSNVNSGWCNGMRCGNVVTLWFALNPKAFTARTVIGTVPAGCRPPSDMYGIITSMSEYFIVNSSGQIQFNAGATGNRWGSITYVCDR